MFSVERSKIKKKVNNVPWLTKGTSISCRRKNILYRKSIRTKNPQNDLEYKIYRNKLNAILRISEKMYYNDCLNNVKGNMKETWKILKTVLNKHKSCGKLPCSEFKHENKVITDPTDIANKFNEYFTNIGPNLAKGIPVVDKSIQDFMSGNHIGSMFLNPVTKEELCKLINHEKTNKASGYDGFYINIVKLISEYILEPLTHVYNQSFTHGCFPKVLKIAKVIPLFKSGDASSFSYYRPISILPVFSKFLKKIFYSRLIMYVNQKQIFSSSQYGFREGLSTTLALIDDISTAIEEKKYTIGIFIDLRKAFDINDHNILITKLDHYGIRGLSANWLISYLSGREQYVSFSNRFSKKLNVKCGVPQGSNLGPLLFIIYMNDMNNVSTLLKLILFADDTNIFFSIYNLQNAQTIINTKLTKLSDWFKVNKLSLNIEKTNLIVFTTPQKKMSVKVNIVIDYIEIEQVKHT